MNAHEQAVAASWESASPESLLLRVLAALDELAAAAAVDEPLPAGELSRRVGIAEAVEAIRTALAEPAGGPVAWRPGLVRVVAGVEVTCAVCDEAAWLDGGDYDSIPYFVGLAAAREFTEQCGPRPWSWVPLPDGGWETICGQCVVERECAAFGHLWQDWSPVPRGAGHRDCELTWRHCARCETPDYEHVSGAGCPDGGGPR